MNLSMILVAKYFIILPVLAALYCAWTLEGAARKRYLLIGVISLPVAYIIAKIGSHFYFDARPFTQSGIAPLIAHAADNGFPSDHTLLASAIAAVITVFNTRIGAALWLIALSIGAARVLAGVHHPIDIVGSMLIAAVVTYAVACFIRSRTKPQLS